MSKILLTELSIVVGAALLVVARRLLRQRDSSSTSSVLRHVVLFRLKEDAPADEFVAAFDVLAEELCELIAGYERGVQCSVEPDVSKGMTHAFVLTFADAAARDKYVPHPKHTEFVERWVKPNIADVCVTDFEVEYSLQAKNK
uniref:Stress-response A/B barrel domain-containing protein n=1 Tax=Coccolithus braarudii TaxID=221442 RepID=A0A7S0LSV8_9EUKA|mmetsp:Transcript_52007/g.111198  ORF Transcript_52007/g.111198 Transcript_52007/m.111198 type:complete len:143 (+) Transcript_52007:18-446(+)